MEKENICLIVENHETAYKIGSGIKVEEKNAHGTTKYTDFTSVIDEFNQYSGCDVQVNDGSFNGEVSATFIQYDEYIRYVFVIHQYFVEPIRQNIPTEKMGWYKFV